MRKAQKNDSPRENGIEGVSAARIKKSGGAFLRVLAGDRGFAEVCFADRDFLRTSLSDMLTLLLAPDAFAPCCFFSVMANFPTRRKVCVTTDAVYEGTGHAKTPGAARFSESCLRIAEG